MDLSPLLKHSLTNFFPGFHIIITSSLHFLSGFNFLLL
ncbi:hypothetical protein Godav_023027, partial [Gossypium davidsonii]|nr:hypothetical protein [Gossypium davidsonii]MBA0663979.1 hypothetical protein [Gossypium klotzschianum]